MARQNKEKLRARITTLVNLGFTQENFIKTLGIMGDMLDSLDTAPIELTLSDESEFFIDCDNGNVLIELDTTKSAVTMNFRNVSPRTIIDLSITKNLAGDCTLTLASNELDFRGYDDADYDTTPDIVLSGSSGNEFTVSMKVTKKYTGSKLIGYVGVGSDAS